MLASLAFSPLRTLLHQDGLKRNAPIIAQQLEPDFGEFLLDPASQPGSGKRKKRQQERPKRLSKEAKLHVGCYGCGAGLQTDEPGAAGYVEPARYELKAQHRQLRLLLCQRCRSLSHGEILPAVVEGRLRASAAGKGVTTPEELRAELAPLRHRKVLAVLLVDVSDGVCRLKLVPPASLRPVAVLPRIDNSPALCAVALNRSHRQLYTPRPRPHRWQPDRPRGHKVRLASKGHAAGRCAVVAH